MIGFHWLPLHVELAVGGSQSLTSADGAEASFLFENLEHNKEIIDQSPIPFKVLYFPIHAWIKYEVVHAGTQYDVVRAGIQYGSF